METTSNIGDRSVLSNVSSGSNIFNVYGRPCGHVVHNILAINSTHSIDSHSLLRKRHGLTVRLTDGRINGGTDSHAHIMKLHGDANLVMVIR